MDRYSQKQKIILGILTAIVVAFICYYVYGRNEETQTNLAIEENVQTQDREEYSDDTLVVHVSGAVNKEDVIELKVGSRISDAIEKVGGLREDADVERINLAYLLEDGMKIHIPTKQERQDTNEEEYITTSSGISNSNEADEQQQTKSTKININTATQTQLETLPGIGPSTASKIITYREEKGKFKSIDEIKEVSGIGEAKFTRIKEFITV